MVLKTGCVKDGKICVSQIKIMKTVIPLEKKHIFHHGNIAYQKDAIPDCTLSLNYVSAVSPIARDGHLR